MSDDMKANHAHSPEFEIDQTVDDLIKKLIAGKLTPEEESLYHQLLAQRSRLMRTFVRVERRGLAA